MKIIFLKNFFRGFVYYMKHNPGAIFVILFMVSLMTAAVFLIFKQEKIAIHIGNLAYLFLIIGTIIYIVQLYLEGRSEKKDTN